MGSEMASRLVRLETDTAQVDHRTDRIPSILSRIPDCCEEDGYEDDRFAVERGGAFRSQLQSDVQSVRATDVHVSKRRFLRVSSRRSR